MAISEVFKEIDLGMSNFDLEIEDGFQEAIVGKECFGRHTAWNFNGIVYHKDSKFHEDVWQHGVCIETKSAGTLQELMEAVNDAYGCA